MSPYQARVAELDGLERFTVGYKCNWWGGGGSWGKGDTRVTSSAHRRSKGGTSPQVSNASLG